VRIVFDDVDAGPERQKQPPFFGDLHLDQVVEAVTAGRDEYDLKPLFYTPLDRVEAIAYRHGVLEDLEDERLRAAVDEFAKAMRSVRTSLERAAALRYRYEQGGWFLEAVGAYCRAVAAFRSELAGIDLRSRALLAFRDHVDAYAASEGFLTLLTDASALEQRLAGVEYCLHLNGSRIRVTRYASEADYGAEIEATFAKFKQGAARDYRVEFPVTRSMNHVEAEILELVARLYPEVFAELLAFAARHREFLDDAIRAFDRDVQFYLAYLRFIAPLEGSGLRFCRPQVSADHKAVAACDAFDLALANTLVSEPEQVVCNDVRLDDPERIVVVSGPNQGGKTTFARMFGQLHYLASLGLPVPGRDARLFLCDRVFTHFEREEDLENRRGRLEEDLVRMHEILARATPRSVVVVNESFTSTTIEDAVFLGRKVMEELIRLDLLAVCVTFVEELASLGDTVVSATSTVDPANPAVRTYKVVRRPADGLAYAMAIAEKHGLTYDRLKERLPT
jgi:hypothetical protein